MQVRIEIDVKPEELRRFLGLPDVAGLQDDFVEFLREKVGTASEFDPTAFLRGNFDSLKNYPAVKRLLAAAKMTVEEEGEAAEPAKKRPSRTRRPPAASENEDEDEQ